MKYDYRIVWTGETNQTLSLGGLSFLSGIPKYFTNETIPMTISKMNKLDSLSIENGEFIDPTDSLPEGVNPFQVQEKVTSVGIVWRGSSRLRTVTLNGNRVTLENGVPNFDFSDSDAKEIVRTNAYIEKVNRTL